MNADWEQSWIMPNEYDIAKALHDKLSHVIEMAVMQPWSPVTGFNMMENMLGADANLPKPIKTDVKVTINHMEVISDDPDRLAVGFDELVQTTLSRKGLTPGYTPPAWQRG